LNAGVRVPAGATPDEATAIIDAIESLLQRRAAQRAMARSRDAIATRSGPGGWAAAARREALDDRV
jgi:hypothetical protein